MNNEKYLEIIRRQGIKLDAELSDEDHQKMIDGIIRCMKEVQPYGKTYNGHAHKFTLHTEQLPIEEWRHDTNDQAELFQMVKDLKPNLSPHYLTKIIQWCVQTIIDQSKKFRPEPWYDDIKREIKKEVNKL